MVNEDRNPYCTNLRKRQRFNCKKMNNDDIIFFEYILLMSSQFGLKEFYRSDAVVLRDTFIKRTRLRNSKDKFIALGFLSIEIKGNPSIQFYTIHYDLLLKNLGSIYQPEFIDDMKKYLIEDMRKTRCDYSLPINEQQKQIKLISELEKIYLKTYKQKRIKPPVNNLKYNDKILKHLYAISFEYSYNDILTSFENYVYSIIEENSKPKNILSLFTSISEYDKNSFAKLQYHLDCYEKRY